MTVTVVKGLLQPLAAERSRAAYANPQAENTPAKASQAAATTVAQSTDAVVTTLRSNSSSVDRSSRSKPIESEKEAKKVADGVASQLKMDKSGQASGAHNLSAGSEKSLA